MKVQTTVLVVFIIGSCLTFNLLDACSRETQLIRARRKVNSLLSSFPELVDEVRNGTLGPNRNNSNNNNNSNSNQGTSNQGTNNQQGTTNNQQGTTNDQQGTTSN